MLEMMNVNMFGDINSVFVNVIIKLQNMIIK